MPPTCGILKILSIFSLHLVEHLDDPTREQLHHQNHSCIRQFQVQSSQREGNAQLHTSLLIGMKSDWTIFHPKPSSEHLGRTFVRRQIGSIQSCLGTDTLILFYTMSGSNVDREQDLFHPFLSGRFPSCYIHVWQLSKPSIRYEHNYLPIHIWDLVVHYPPYFHRSRALDRISNLGIISPSTQFAFVLGLTLSLHSVDFIDHDIGGSCSRTDTDLNVRTNISGQREVAN